MSKTGESQKTIPRKLANFLDFSEIFALGSSLQFFFCRRLANFRQKKTHTHCYERLVSTWNTSVKSLQIDLYSLDSECAPGFRFSRKYFWELNGLSFKGIRRRKNGDQPQEGLAQYGYGPAMTCTNN